MAQGTRRVAKQVHNDQIFVFMCMFVCIFFNHDTSPDFISV